MMTITVNGSERQLDDGVTVAGLLQHLELGDQRVAVAVNRDVVPRGEHDACVLSEGDRVEIVRAVQGG